MSPSQVIVAKENQSAFGSLRYLLIFTGAPNIHQAMHIFLRSPLLFCIVWSLAFAFQILVETEVHNGDNNGVRHSEAENASTTSDDGRESSLKTFSPTLSRMSSSLPSKCLCDNKEEFQLLINAAFAEASCHGIDISGKHNVEYNDVSHAGSNAAGLGLSEGHDIFSTSQ